MKFKSGIIPGYDIMVFSKFDARTAYGSPTRINGAHTSRARSSELSAGNIYIYKARLLIGTRLPYIVSSRRHLTQEADIRHARARATQSTFDINIRDKWLRVTPSTTLQRPPSRHSRIRCRLVFQLVTSHFSPSGIQRERSAPFRAFRRRDRWRRLKITAVAAYSNVP